ncbi:flagellar hook assembly protein FlgD [Jannaschia sp. Os4]|uniref:flagellar hook assembly protein FlgD n=1 Tax=Jannaschia sp. Os4 TaxID=2807617 RepID=UPI00193A2796|nr:flagellar hook assembly protein FlgD [Jannaschia sp. Os4]MBM2575689.1 flagellar hook assembly protein FlgD [Jannaschia sp. Os4]
MDVAGIRGTAEPHGDSRTKLSADYEAFLQLLTAQVANQDPLAPMDSSTYVTQLAQLSQVEQAVQTNERLSEISSRLAVAGSYAEVGLIGREVDLSLEAFAPRPDGTPIGIRFDAAVPAHTIRLIDPDGLVVRELPGGAAMADEWSEVEWDGLDAQGAPAGEGPFILEVVASDAAGAAVPYSTRLRATVEGVVIGPQGTRLVLDTGEEVGPGDVLRIG